jgi:hypothetical protein
MTDCNDRFYEAFRTGDMDMMRAVWGQARGVFTTNYPPLLNLLLLLRRASV